MMKSTVFTMTYKSHSTASQKRTILSFWETVNAKIGIYQPLWKDTMGKFGIGDINECDERLLQFCIANELFVANKAFPHKPSRKWTWNHPNGVHKSMIDYVIVRKRWRSSVFGIRSFPAADCGSDHHLVIAKIQLNFKSMWKKATQQHFNIESLKNPEIAQRYQENVQKELTSITQNSKDINITLVAFNKSILSAASNILEQRRSRRKPWISDEVLRLSDARKGLKSKKHESQEFQFQVQLPNLTNS